MPRDADLQLDIRQEIMLRVLLPLRGGGTVEAWPAFIGTIARRVFSRMIADRDHDLGGTGKFGL